jgi:hypothetical protein
MPAGHKTFHLRGGDDFPGREITMKEARHYVGNNTWEKWGRMIPDYPIRDLIALIYTEGLYHGAVLAQIGKIDMLGMTADSGSSAVASAASSETTAIETLTVRDLFDSL